MIVRYCLILTLRATRNVWGGKMSYKLVDKEEEVVGEHKGESMELLFIHDLWRILGSDTGTSVKIPAAA